MKKRYILFALIIGNCVYMPAFANGWGKNKRSDNVESLSISPTPNVKNASKLPCTQTSFDDFLKPATCYQSNQAISASEAIHLKSFRQLMTLAGSGQDIGSFISDHLAILASKNTNQYINNLRINNQSSHKMRGSHVGARRMILLQFYLSFCS